jgi:hypothetical protein
MTGASKPRVDIQSLLQLTELADYVVPFAIRVIADLGIADHLRAGPRAVEDLAAATGAHAPSLHRVLRALACKGVFTEVAPGRFGLTPLAQPLRSDHPLSLREAYPLLAADVQAWARFDYSVRSGRAAFDLVHGVGYWEYLEAHPVESQRFSASQRAATRLELPAVLRSYDWAAFETIVDVGGGNGAFLAGILRRHTELRGVLFDLPHIVAGAPDVLAAAGVADRCEIVAGSFFESLPPGRDVYLLKRILYGWDDEHASEILTTARTAMRLDSRILVIEPGIESGGNVELAAILDVMMLAIDGGRTRTPEQLERLFAPAGLKLTRVVPTVMFPIIEALPT